MSQVPAAAFSILYGTDIRLTETAFSKLASGKVLLLGVSGRMASGKDTVAPKLVEKLGYAESSFHGFFAKALKDEVNQIIEIIRETVTRDEAIEKVTLSLKALEGHARVMVNVLWQEVKEGVINNSYDRTQITRQALQYWGTDCRRAQDDDYWVKQTMGEMISRLAAGNSVFLTDARFENEVDSIERAGGYSVRLKVSQPVQIARLYSRDNLNPSLEALNHLSENALNDYEKDERFTVVIDTDLLDADEVTQEALTAIEHEMILKNSNNSSHPVIAKINLKSFFVARPLEPVILGVDLDEVCFDYLGGLRKRLEAKGYIIPPGKNISWSLMKSGWVESEEEFRERHAEAVLDGLYRGLEVLPGAKENMKELSAAGYELNIITSRFVVPGQHEIVVRETAEALDAARLPYSNIMFQKNKVRFLADAYLDDGPHNIEALRDAGRYVIKMNQLYNMHLDGPAADNWWEARALLKERFGR